MSRHSITFCEREIPLVFDMAAAERIEEQLGSLKKLYDNLRQRKQLRRTLDVAYRAMARSAMEHGADINDEIIDAGAQWQNPLMAAEDMRLYTFNQNAIVRAINDGFLVSYQTPEERRDKYLAAANRAVANRKKNNDIPTTIDIYSKALEAGFSYTEARGVRPGFILDIYLRQQEREAMTAGAIGGLGKLLGAGGKRKRR